MTVYAPAISLPGDNGVLASLFRSSNRILQGDELRLFRNRPPVVLSSGFNDACSSLGAFLAHLSTGHLVNVFTQNGAVTHSGFDVMDREDAAFAARCHLTRHDLGCEAPDRRARNPHDLSGLADDLAQIGAPVLDCMEKIAAGFAPGHRGVLLCPLGTGRDVNRRALALLIARELPRLRRQYDVHFYEELPYASQTLMRGAALHRLRQQVTLATRHVFPARWWNKRELLQLYPSRFQSHPRPARFSPAAMFPAFSHEAFWSVV